MAFRMPGTKMIFVETVAWRFAVKLHMLTRMLQKIPGLLRGQGNLKRSYQSLSVASFLALFFRNNGFNELQNLKYLPRSMIEREIVFEDRTPAHADHVGFGFERKTTAAVGEWLERIESGKSHWPALERSNLRRTDSATTALLL